MKLFVKTPPGKIITLLVKGNATIELVKDMIRDLEDIPSDQNLYLFYKTFNWQLLRGYSNGGLLRKMEFDGEPKRWNGETLLLLTEQNGRYNKRNCNKNINFVILLL